MDTRSQLSRCHLCKGLTDPELDRLVATASTRTWPAGALLFTEGDVAQGFFVLLSGLVRIYKASPDGREYTLHRIGPGQMFAEAAIFGGTHYPANAAAIEDSVTAFFPRDAFTDLLARSPQMSLKMIASLSAFVREFNQKLEDLSLREVPARLAAYLLNRSEQSGRPEIVLDLTKTELARTLGTISETLSRCLRKMIDRGMIEVDGARIVITDPARLAAVADGDKI